MIEKLIHTPEGILKVDSPWQAVARVGAHVKIIMTDDDIYIQDHHVGLIGNVITVVPKDITADCGPRGPRVTAEYYLGHRRDTVRLWCYADMLEAV